MVGLQTYDLIVRNARLHRYPDLLDIAAHQGRFVAVGRDLPARNAHREIDAQGRLIAPPFIDAHVHLDAVLTVGQPRYNVSGTLLEGIRIWSERKPTLTHDEVKARALEA